MIRHLPTGAPRSNAAVTGEVVTFRLLMSAEVNSEPVVPLTVVVMLPIVTTTVLPSQPPHGGRIDNFPVACVAGWEETLCSVPLMVSDPLAGTPGEPPPASSTSIDR